MTDWVAYLGAAAWLPQIFNFFRNLIKPVVTITPEKVVSIGYTTFGPIFNLRLSINVDKKDTLINFIGIKIYHESGSQYSFEWAGMTEFFSEVKNDKGENQTVQRDTAPISIKLSTLSLTERFFRFQDSEFIKLNKDKVEKLSEKLRYLKKQNENYHASFIKSELFENYLKFIREKFYWKAGNYTVEFYVHCPVAIKFKKANFKFKLSQDDIDMLKSNVDEVEKDWQYNIQKQGLPEVRPNNWAWLFRDLIKI